MDESSSLLIAAAIMSFILAFITGSICSISFVRLSLLEKISEEENNKKAEKIFRLLTGNKDKILSGFSMFRLIGALILGGIIVNWAIFMIVKQDSLVYYKSFGLLIGILFISEVLPRFISGLNPEKSTISLCPIISLGASVTIPVSDFCHVACKPITSKIKPKGDINSRLTEDEIRRIVEEGHELGIIEEEQKEMIHSIFQFSDTIAREVMVPRVDIVAVEEKATITDVINVMAESGFSRIPIYRDSLDKVLGIIYNKDFLHLVKEGKLDTPAADVARKPPFFVPSTKPVGDLLREMKKKSISIAIVVDEYGGTDGIITIEDLLEEIVGEITDEYDREEPDVTEQAEGQWKVDGSTIIEDVNEELDVDIPTDEHETIGGFVCGVLGHIPDEGESFQMEDEGLEIQVSEVKGQRIQNLIIKKAPKSEEN